MANVKPIQIIPNMTSNSEAWKAYMSALDKRYGTRVSQIVFLKTWERFGTNPTSEFSTYMRDKYGLQIERDFIGSVSDKFSDIGGYFGDILTMGKYAGIAVGVIIIGGLGMIIFNLAKEPAKNIGIAAKAFV